MENKDINFKILSIWDKFKENRGSKYPLLYPKFIKNTILFVGCNPSSSLQRNKKIKTFLNINNLDYLNFSENNDYNISLIINHERVAKQECIYFNKFKYISKKIFNNDFSWDHIDLFYYRETSQNKFKKIVGYKVKKDKCITFNSFGESQLELFLQLIKEINPRVIIVANAFVSEVISNRFKQYILRDNFEENGYDYFIINSKKIPLFFTSMLTGQRALDNASLRRLIWHIKKTIN
jgi:hypothetical protein